MGAFVATGTHCEGYMARVLPEALEDVCVIFIVPGIRLGGSVDGSASETYCPP